MSHEDCGLEIAVQFPPLLQNFLALLTIYPPTYQYYWDLTVLLGRFSTTRYNGQSWQRGRGPGYLAIDRLSRN
jgi:hypothetical protein